MALDGQIPSGPIAEKWDKHQFELKLVNPANKRKHTVIVVGTGLAGASAAATLAELGQHFLHHCLDGLLIGLDHRKTSILQLSFSC